MNTAPAMGTATLLPAGVTGTLLFDAIPLPTDPERLAQGGVEIRQIEFIPTGGDRKKLKEVFKQAAKHGGCTVILRGVGNDVEEFRGLCRHAVAAESGKWLEFKASTDGAWSNFHWARIEQRGQELYTLLNWLYPLLGFKTSVDWSPSGFLDCDEIARHLSHRYRVISAAELQQPIKLDAKKGEIAVLEPPHALAAPEIRGLWHWSRHGKDVVSVGQAIFNYWH